MTPDVSDEPLLVRTTGRHAEDGPCLLLCHGYGAPGDDLVSLSGAFSANVRCFFPEAPLEVDFGDGTVGRAWWPRDPERAAARETPAGREALFASTPRGMGEARARLEATIASLEARRGVGRERLVIGGFSQGAMLATEIALFAERPFAGLVILSGTLLSRERWRAAASAAGSRLHVFMSHGRADPMLPFEGAEALKGLLDDAGARVAWTPHEGQHEIPQVALEGLQRFVAARLGTGA
jgi:phospholipase/carboxylesterase